MINVIISSYGHFCKYISKVSHQLTTHDTILLTYQEKTAHLKKRPLSIFTATINRTVITLLIGVSSMSTHAAILSNDSEQRIQVRYGANTNANMSTSESSSNVYITPTTNNKAGVTIYSGNDKVAGDRMQGLIEQKQRQYEFDSKLSIEENKRVQINKPTPNYNTSYRNNSNFSTSNNTYNNYGNHTNAATVDFNSWLNSSSYRAQQVASYQRYLSSQLGAKNVPPLDQLLTTARSWNQCGYEPYQLPPQELWSNMVPTLRLYSQLKNQGILPPSTEIRSVYRSPNLNNCAGGAANSKHMTAGAIDIWVPEYDDNFWSISNLQDNLCQFWQYQGQSHSFGLGLYSTGAIHLDTQGYRKWGFNHASSSSACRF